MKRSTTRHLTVALALVAFAAALFAPSTADAAWRDHSDEYPGLDNATGTYLLIAAGVAVAAGAIILIAKSGGKDKADSPATTGEADATEEAEETEGEVSRSDDRATETWAADRITESSRFGLYLGLDQPRTSVAADRAPNLSDLGVKAGISLSF